MCYLVNEYGLLLGWKAIDYLFVCFPNIHVVLHYVHKRFRASLEILENRASQVFRGQIEIDRPINVTGHDISSGCRSFILLHHHGERVCKENRFARTLAVLVTFPFLNPTSSSTKRDHRKTTTSRPTCPNSHLARTPSILSVEFPVQVLHRHLCYHLPPRILPIELPH